MGCKFQFYEVNRVPPSDLLGGFPIVSFDSYPQKPHLQAVLFFVRYIIKN